MRDLKKSIVNTKAINSRKELKKTINRGKQDRSWIRISRRKGNLVCGLWRNETREDRTSLDESNQCQIDDTSCATV